MKLQVSRDIEARPQRVWAIVTDLEAWPRVPSGVERVERVDACPGFDVGTRWRETRVVFGKEATEEIQLTAVDAGHSYTTRSDRGRTRYTSVLRVEPLGERSSRLSMSFSAAASGAVTRLLGATVGRLFQRATRRMLERDLADVAAAAEAASAT